MPNSRPTSGVATTSGSPVSSQCAADLAAATAISRLRRQQHLLQRAVGLVAGEQRAHRQHRRQQRADPDDARRDVAQHLRLGPHAEREQAQRDDEEDQRQQRVDAPPRGQLQVAQQHGEEEIPHARPWRSRSKTRGTGSLQARRLVAGQQRRAAARRVLAEQAVERVRCRRRRARRRARPAPQVGVQAQRQPRQRHAPALALAQRAHRGVAAAAHAQALQRGRQRRRRRAGRRACAPGSAAPRWP